MPSPLFLAATAAEFQAMQTISDKIGWMACHFSPYGTGIANLPPALPAGSMLILNDRTPVYGHDPQRIADTLSALAEQYQCSRILLDLQRPGEALTQRIVRAVTEAAGCPVGVTPPYAEDPACPVLLPPVPPHQTPQDYLSPWEGRRVWLEVALNSALYRITEQGCHTEAALSEGSFPHRDEALHCHYNISIRPDAIEFHLCRQADDLPGLLQDASQAECFVGLHQELSQALAHCTAFSQP